MLALVFADLIDDAMWAEVSLAQFVSASATLFASRLLLSRMRGPGTAQ